MMQFGMWFPFGRPVRILIFGFVCNANNEVLAVCQYRADTEQFQKNPHLFTAPLEEVAVSSS